MGAIQTVANIPLPNGGQVRLILADCLNGMATLAEACVDVVVTSPPYNLGVRYNHYDDTLPRERYLAWTSEWAAAVHRVLSPTGSVFLNVGGKPSDPWVPFDVANAFRQRFVLQNTIHWVKSIAIEPEASPGRIQEPLCVGHYKPIRGERFVNDCHEYVFHFTKTGDVPLERLAIGVPYQDKSNVSRWKSARHDLHCRGNTWFVPYETIQSRERDRPHPATFPTRLPEMCLKLHGLSRIRLVLDPFIGLGATAVACVRLGVSCIGFDVDSSYLDVAADRVRQATG